MAVAAALAVQGIAATDLIDTTLARTPVSEVASRLKRIPKRPFTAEPKWIAGEVGCGLQISAPDTVPYAIWCAARHLDDLPEALWATASAGGDVDTTCAITAANVAGRTGLDTVPREWLAACESLPTSIGSYEVASR